MMVNMMMVPMQIIIGVMELLLNADIQNEKLAISSKLRNAIPNATIYRHKTSADLMTVKESDFSTIMSPLPNNILPNNSAIRPSQTVRMAV